MKCMTRTTSYNDVNCSFGEHRTEQSFVPQCWHLYCPNLYPMITQNNICVVTPIQFNTKRGLDHFFQLIKEVISDAVGNSSCFLTQMKFLPAQLVENFILIKGAV